MNITIENLTKTYGYQKAVDDISFSVNTGEILGFLGPNGAGKTTTMKMITGYLGIEKGDIQLGGTSVKDFPEKIKKKIGYLPESNPLYTDMPVIDYLAFCAALEGVDKFEIHPRVRQMVKVCGLNAEKHKKIGELSKGYRQRVGLAQAMIHDPEVLILDEPTTGLDPNQIVEIRSLIRDLGKEKTVILSTHILPEAEATCDRILIINKGKIVADGTAENLGKKAKDKEIVRLRVEDAKDPNLVFQSLQALPVVESVDFLDRSYTLFEVHGKPGQNSKRALFELCVKNKWVITEMTPVETKLEDVFRNLTQN